MTDPVLTITDANLSLDGNAGRVDILHDISLTVGRPSGERMDGCGMIIVNPPFTLEKDIIALRPLLEKHLAREGERASLKVTKLRRE